jgi:hypothetical protein
MSYFNGEFNPFSFYKTQIYRKENEKSVFDFEIKTLPSNIAKKINHKAHHYVFGGGF